MRSHWRAVLMLLGLLASEAEDWDGLVKKYVEAYESVKEPVPTAYPWVAKRLRTLFGVRGVGHIQVFSEMDGKRTLVSDLYYKAGELHVINHDKGWNLVTKGNEAYEWETGEKEGQITKLKNEDLIDYLLYLTDPSCIMTCFYHDALYEPGTLPRKARSSVEFSRSGLRSRSRVSRRSSFRKNQPGSAGSSAATQRTARPGGRCTRSPSRSRMFRPRSSIDSEG